jgi:exopolysaccharide biosynthesis polyprenyl glycosylphosphotransferase
VRAKADPVNASERSALLQGLTMYDDLASAVDARTLDILDNRRKTARVKRRGWLVRRMLLLADLLGLLLAFAAAQALFGFEVGFGDTGKADRFDLWFETLLFLVTLPAWIVVVKLYGLYDHDEERTDHTTVDDLVGVFHMVTVGTWLFYVGAWLTGVVDPDLMKLATFWLLAIALVTLGRGAARALSRRSLAYIQNAVIIGAGDVGQLVARKLINHPEYGINLVGFVDDQPKERREDLGTLTLLGSTERLPGIVRLFDVERVIIAFSNDSHERTLELIRSLKDLDVQIDIVPRLFELVSPGVGVHTVEGLPLVGLPPLRLARSSRLLKRAMDLAIALAALVLLAPFLALIALLIKRGSPGPVFFRQVRMGCGDQTFRIYKFRTMVIDADERKGEYVHMNKYAENGGDGRMFKIPDDPRVTRVGRFLRRYSLDELPQLINVVRGEMSLVGPRPLILEEDQHVAEWGRNRLNLKPGITGPWQVLGRNEIPFDEMVKLDYLYVTNWSLWRDLRLMLQTVPAAVTRRVGSY